MADECGCSSSKPPTNQALRHPELVLDDVQRKEKIEDIVKGFSLSKDTMMRFFLDFKLELAKGFNPEEETTMLMINTHVSQFPDRSEVGEYLGLELDSSRIRVCLMVLKGRDSEPDVDIESYLVPPDVRQATDSSLFDFIANSLHEFLSKRNLLEKQLPLGFTLGFPYYQKEINSGILITWGSRYKDSASIGKDVSLVLSEALSRKNLSKVELVAILSNATSTLVQGAFQNPKCAIGLVLGTGYNICYLDKSSLYKEYTCEGDKVIVNTECGLVGDEGNMDYLKTEFDTELDEKSDEPSSFTMDKIAGGAHLGELMRLVLLKLFNELGFSGCKLNLETPGSLDMRFVLEAEEDNLDDAGRTKANLTGGFGLAAKIAEEVAIVKHVSALMCLRTAMIASICVACLMKRMGCNEATIAVDGALYRKNPRMNSYLHTFLHELVPRKKFEIILAEDGTIKGAALTAAIIKKKKKA